MITNEERRRVASNLRESRYILKPCPHGKQVISARRVASELELAHEGEYLCQNGLERLADLIDRPTCRNTVKDSELCGFEFQCSHCELAWSFDVGDLEDNDFNYCPKCGREVVE